MKINNIIEKTFAGPPIFAGYLFLITGVLQIPLNDFTLISVVFGFVIAGAACFVIFTFSGVEIDTEKHRVKQYQKIFGLFKTGKWENLDLYLGVTLIPMKKVYSVASRSNQTTSSSHKDYRIFLVNKAKRPAFAIKTCKTPQQAQNSLDEFSIWLKVPVYSVKRRMA